jgi:isoquinoline 1-oxidoreductase beta subunit
MTTRNPDMNLKKTDDTPGEIADVTEMNRRDFLTTTAAVGGAMVLGFWLPPRSAQAQSPAPAYPAYRDPLVPEINAWLTIAADDTVTIRVGQTECGNGVFTTCPMIVAEELQCDWKKVRPEYASANRNVREKAPEWTLKVPGNGLHDPAGGGAVNINGEQLGATGVYRRMSTFSSGSVRTGRYYLQFAGAEARERLLLAAATAWGVPVSELVAKDSVITHAKSKRRTTYGAVAAAAARIQLPDPSKIKIKSAEKFTLMGTEQKSLDVPVKVTGQAVYGIDIQLPGMLYAAMKACPVWGGDVKSYDADAIKNRPGVHSVVRLPANGPLSGGVAVVADTWWRAKTALDAMPLEWDYGKNASVSSDSLLKAAFDVLAQPGTMRVDEGDVDAEMRRATKIVEATYTVPYVAHASMEPGNATALVTSGRVDLWTGSQYPDRCLTSAAQASGLAPENVYVHTLFLGGGYGVSNNLGHESLPGRVVAIAKTLNGRPVKLLWTREEDWGATGGGHRPMGIATFKAGLDAAGWPIAIEVHTSGAEYNPVDQQYRGLTTWPYFVSHYRYLTHNPGSYVPLDTRRGTGSSTNCFYIEGFIDELAHVAGKDPYAYRRELLARNPVGKPGSGGFLQRNDWLKALDLAAKMSGWGTPLPRGFARGIAIDDRRRGLSQTANTYTTVCAQVHTISVSPRGQIKLHRSDIAFDEGFSFVNRLTVKKQIEGQIHWGYDDALYQEVTIRNGQPVELNFDTYIVSRMHEYPKEVNIGFFKGNKWIYGVGEEAIPQVAPAIVNAVFKVTGKRIRSLPLKNQDLSWG